MDNENRNSIGIFSAFITKNAMVIAVLDV